MTLIDNVDDYLYLKESENGNLKFEVDAHQLDLRLHHFSQFPLNVKKKKKLAGLWLAGEVVNHVGIYGSKAAEGLSAFQRRSCLFCGIVLLVWGTLWSSSFWWLCEILQQLHC